MAEGMSQAEIDMLLKDTYTESADEELNDATGNETPVNEKVYRAPKTKRFELPRGEYCSPIVENYVFNPSPNQPEPQDKVVVRSLENFREYLISRNGKLSGKL